MRVARQHETIVEQEARVALLAVGIEDLVAWEDFLETLDDEAFAAIAIEPTGLFGQAMVEHIGHRDKGVSLYLLDHDAEHAGAH